MEQKIIDATGIVSHAPEMGCPPAKFTDPSEDEELINQFPNLVPLPAGDAECEDFVNRYSILKGERIRFCSLMSHLAREAHRAKITDSDISEDGLREKRWRALHGFYAIPYDLRAENFERDALWFQAALDGARTTVNFLVDTYMPLRFHRQLNMNSSLAGETDPAKLMRLCIGRGTDVLSCIHRFEARRQLTLAQLNFEAMLKHGTRQELETRLGLFVGQCEEKFFVPGKSEQMMVIAELDPANAYRASSFRILPRSFAAEKITPRDTQIVLPLDVRFVSDNGGTFPVFFDVRVKDHFALKQLVKRERRLIPTDLWAAQFVFFDEDHDLMRGIELLRKSVANVPGTVSGEASNAQRAGVVDPTNHHSSHEYRATKYDITLLGNPLELTFKYLLIFINELVSRGRECHRLYKLATYLDRLFPVIFPTSLYGIDWRDPDLRQLLWNFQLRKL